MIQKKSIEKFVNVMVKHTTYSDVFEHYLLHGDTLSKYDLNCHSPSDGVMMLFYSKYGMNDYRTVKVIWRGYRKQLRKTKLNFH